MNVYFVVFAILLVGSLIALAAYFVDRAKGPIIWTWDEHSPIEFARSGDNYGIYAFSFKGRNRSELPITDIRTFVRSNINARIVPLFFVQGQLLPPENVVISPGGSFNLVGVLPKDGPMISFDAFRRDFGQFTFSFSHEGKLPFEKTFSEADVERMIKHGYEFHQDLYRKSGQTMGTDSGVQLRQ